MTDEVGPLLFLLLVDSNGETVTTAKGLGPSVDLDEKGLNLIEAGKIPQLFIVMTRQGIILSTPRLI